MLMEVSRQIVQECEASGFIFDEPWRDTPKLLMYIVTELSEAMEAWRDDDREAFTEEMADTFIRWAHLVGLLRLPIGKAIVEKREKNRMRPRIHGRKQY